MRAFPGAAHPGIERIPADAEHPGYLGPAPPLRIQHEGHTIIGTHRRQGPSQEVTSLDLDHGIRGQVGDQRENAGLARFIEGIELDRTRGELTQVPAPPVRDVRKAAHGEEVLQGHTPVRIPLTPGQRLGLESLKAVLHGFRRDVLR